MAQQGYKLATLLFSPTETRTYLLSSHAILFFGEAAIVAAHCRIAPQRSRSMSPSSSLSRADVRRASGDYDNFALFSCLSLVRSAAAIVGQTCRVYSVAMNPSESGLHPPIPPQIAAIERPIARLMTYYVIRAALAFVALPVVLPILYFRYHTMRYKFDAEGIHMGWGILMHHEIMLNYSRIQDIHLRSNVIERWLGLARIVVQTAAGSSDSEMTLEGLTDHVAMRDFLYDRMRGARHLNTPRDSPDAQPNELAQTLSLIASELRAIRTLIEEKRPLV